MNNFNEQKNKYSLLVGENCFFVRISSFRDKETGEDSRWGGRPPSRTGRGDEISAEWLNDRPPTYAHEYEQQNSKKFGFGYQVEILDIV
ncbi:MAG: hypothetical protein L6Q38_12925, partial [Nitrospira sp.]|nr:hypothetical protein [Nitrospira sp.]